MGAGAALPARHDRDRRGARAAIPAAAQTAARGGQECGEQFAEPARRRRGPRDGDVIGLVLAQVMASDPPRTAYPIAATASASSPPAWLSARSHW